MTRTIGLFVCLVLALSGWAVAADPDTRKVTEQRTAPPKPAAPRDASPIRSAPPASAVDSVAEDLQRIVVLCATEPDSAAFRDAWAEYVTSHYRPGMDVDALIDEVLERAAAERARNASGKRAIPVPSDDTLRKSMHDTAKSSIQNIRA